MPADKLSERVSVARDVRAQQRGVLWRYGWIHAGHDIEAGPARRAAEGIDRSTSRVPLGTGDRDFVDADLESPGRDRRQLGDPDQDVAGLDADR